MSYKIVIDEQQRRRLMANSTNELFRHCRIGKVTMKPTILQRLDLLDGLKWTPWVPGKQEWWQNPSCPTFATPNTASCVPTQ